jgi:hypothetical protein
MPESSTKQMTWIIAAHDQYIWHELHETSSKLAGGYKSNLLHMTSMRKVKGSFWVFWRRCHWFTVEKMWVFFVWNLDAIAKFLQVMVVGPTSWRQKSLSHLLLRSRGNQDAYPLRIYVLLDFLCQQHLLQFPGRCCFPLSEGGTAFFTLKKEMNPP